MPFLGQENILKDNDNFISRVRMALTRVANTVIGEPIGTGALATERRNKRHARAVEVHAAPQVFQERVARSILALGTFSGGSLTATYNATITDEQLQTEITNLWNDLSGVTSEEAAT